MSHWSERYVGRKYVPGQYDCGSLIQEVLRDQFGVAMQLPGKAQAVSCQVRQLDSLRDELAFQVTDPAEGDLVLMRAGGRCSHCGVLAIIGGARYVLHAVRSAGQVLLQPERDLATYGCRLVGYYRPR